MPKNRITCSLQLKISWRFIILLTIIQFCQPYQPQSNGRYSVSYLKLLYKFGSAIIVVPVTKIIPFIGERPGLVVQIDRPLMLLRLLTPPISGYPNNRADKIYFTSTIHTSLRHGDRQRPFGLKPFLLDFLSRLLVLREFSSACLFFRY